MGGSGDGVAPLLVSPSRLGGREGLPDDDKDDAPTHRGRCTPSCCCWAALEEGRLPAADESADSLDSLPMRAPLRPAAAAGGAGEAPFLPDEGLKDPEGNGELSHGRRCTVNGCCACGCAAREDGRLPGADDSPDSLDSLTMRWPPPTKRPLARSTLLLSRAPRVPSQPSHAAACAAAATSAAVFLGRLLQAAPPAAATPTATAGPATDPVRCGDAGTAAI